MSIRFTLHLRLGSKIPSHYDSFRQNSVFFFFFVLDRRFNNIVALNPTKLPTKPET